MGNNKSSLKSIGEIISGNYNFFIPAYQRGYRWSKREVEDLLNDILEFMNTKKNDNDFYCLQPLVIKRDKKNNHYEVIDGQQRLTTIYLILQFFNARYTKEYRKKLFKIFYETRKKSKEFLEGIIDNTEDYLDNIDFFNIYSNFNYIKEFFNDKANLINDFESILLNKVKFIWYELPENEKEIKVFQRLNIGKIPLTNSELIKAILLYHLKDHKDRLLLISEWDFIEKTLQDDRFFSFIYSGKDYDKPTRIDFIFEILANELETSKDKKSIPKYDDRKSFYTISKKLNEKETDKEEITKEIWSKVKTIFRIFEEFYNDNTYYHFVGYLVNIGKNINKIINKYQSKDRNEFEKFLIKEIKKQFKDKNLSKLDYEDTKDKKDMERLLFLYNVILTKKSNEQNKQEEKSIFPFIYNRYPFDLHKKEKWSLEHINPQTPTNLDISKAKKTLERWKELKIKKWEKLENKIEKALKSKNDEEIIKLLNDLYSRLYQDEEIQNNINSIKNLTLLPGEINSSLQNSLFIEKRNKIIEKYEKKGKFVPIGTRNVFLKYYTKEIKHFEIWDKEDMNSYFEDLGKKLGKFIEIGDENAKRKK